MESEKPVAPYRQIFYQQIRFALSSSIATITDYGLFLTLVGNIFNPVISNLISSGTGMVINLLINRNSMFELRRKYVIAILIGIGFSLLGLLASTGFLYLLNHYAFFADRQYLAKLVVISVFFFYNFYFKRFAYEKRLV